MIIGMYALQKRIIGIKNSIVIIVNNMSNTDADLNTILNILISLKSATIIQYTIKGRFMSR